MTGQVAFVVDGVSNPYAGTEGQLLNLIEGLRQHGVSCELVSLQSSEYLERGDVPCPVTILGRGRMAEPGTWMALWRIGRDLAGRGVGVAQTFMIDASVVAPLMFRLSGIRTLVSRRDLGYWYTPAYRAVLRRTSRVAAGYVCNSEAVARVTRETEGVSADRCHVIYNGLPVLRESPPPVPELVSLQESGALIIGLVANIRPIKRIEDLVDAVALLCRKGGDVHAAIVGSGDPGPLRERARAAGVSERVHFLGGRADVAACLQHFHVGALCSESEGFSNTLLEYMRAGLPVVCTNAGGNPEAVRHGETGFLYPVGDVAALSQALEAVLLHGEKRSRMGALARDEAVERYSTEVMVSAHMDLYERILNGK